MMHANRVCRFVCRFSAAKYSVRGDELRQVVTFHRGITTFCRCLLLFQTALQALRLHLEEATVCAFEFRAVAQSGPA